MGSSLSRLGLKKHTHTLKYLVLFIMQFCNFESLNDQYSPFDKQTPAFFHGKTVQTQFSKELDNMENGYRQKILSADFVNSENQLNRNFSVIEFLKSEDLVKNELDRFLDSSFNNENNTTEPEETFCENMQIHTPTSTLCESRNVDNKNENEGEGDS